MYSFQFNKLLKQLERIADALEESNEFNREIIHNF